MAAVGVGTPSNIHATLLREEKKQEYLMASPSSHSLFTFIGEQHGRWESPGKRLDFINKKIKM